MFENPRRGRQARNCTTNVPKILDLKSSSEQIFSRKLSLGAPALCVGLSLHCSNSTLKNEVFSVIEVPYSDPLVSACVTCSGVRCL